MKHWPSDLAKIVSVHHKVDISPVWYFQMCFPVNNLQVQTTLSHDIFGSKPISAQLQTWDGRRWISLRSSGTDFESKCIFVCWIVILGDNDVSFEFRLARRFIISDVDSLLSCFLISLYIWAILWIISHARLRSIFFAQLLIMIYNFTNPVLLLFLCVSWPYSLQFTRLITEQVYLHE